MPTYEYKCPECEIRFAVIRSILEEDPGYDCETCKIQMNQVYSLGGITFKGSGFYRTDK